MLDYIILCIGMGMLIWAGTAGILGIDKANNLPGGAVGAGAMYALMFPVAWWITIF